MAEKVMKNKGKNKVDQRKSNKKNKGVRFFKDLKNELKRVTWLSWPKLVKNTLTVIVACLIIGGIIWIFDAAIGKIISLALLR